MIFFKYCFHHLFQLKRAQCTLLQTDELLTIFPACLKHSHRGNLCLECDFLLTFSSASLNSLHPVGLSSSPSLHESSVTIPSNLSHLQILWCPIHILLTFLCSSLCKSCRLLRGETVSLFSSFGCTCNEGRTRFWSAHNGYYFLISLVLIAGDRLCQFDECLSIVAGIPLLVQVPAETSTRCQEQDSFWFTFPHPAIVPQTYCWLWSARSGKSSVSATHGTEISSPRDTSRKSCFRPLSPAQLPPVLLGSSPLGGIQSFSPCPLWSPTFCYEGLLCPRYFSNSKFPYYSSLSLAKNSYLPYIYKDNRVSICDGGGVVKGGNHISDSIQNKSDSPHAKLWLQPHTKEKPISF